MAANTAAPSSVASGSAVSSSAASSGASIRGGSRQGVRPDEVAARAARSRAIGLFRYQLIREAADPVHSTRARGRMVREIAARTHLDPDGRPVRVSRDTLDRWIRAWRRGGFDALVPAPRQAGLRIPVEVIEMAVALKRENPARTAAQVRRILRAQLGWAPGERTLQRHFAELDTDPLIAAQLGAIAAGGPGARAGVRPVRGRPAERAVDRRRPARTSGRWAQDLPVRLPGRPLPRDRRAPVRVRRGHRAPGRRFAPGARVARGPGRGLCR